MSDKTTRDPFFGSDDWVQDTSDSVSLKDSVNFESENPDENVFSTNQMRRSIRLKVYAAFTVLFVLLLVPAASSLFSFYELNKTITSITEESEFERQSRLEIRNNADSFLDILKSHDLANLYQFEADQIISRAENFNTEIGETILTLNTLTVSQNREFDEASQLVQYGLIGTLASSAVVILIMIGLIYLVFERNLLRRIKNLHDAVTRIHSGEVEGLLPVEGNDEISDLTLAIDYMRRSTQEVEKLRMEQDVLESHSRERRRSSMLFLSENFEGSVKTIAENLSEYANSMQSSSGTMLRSTEGNREQVQEVSDVVNASKENIQSVSAAIKEINQRTEEVGKRVQRSTDAALSAVDKAKEATTTVKDLSETVQKIGEVAIIIKNIADQTNLLALNASIEAARAGEAGRGFAVVAGEVKNLASQTASATEEIGQQIELVQKGTANTVEVIDDMSSAIKDISNFAILVSEVIDQQKDQMTKIDQTTSKVTENSNLVDNRVTQIVKSSIATEDGAKDVASSASVVSDYVVQLNTEVQRFLDSIRDDKA